MDSQGQSRYAISDRSLAAMFCTTTFEVVRIAPSAIRGFNPNVAGMMYIGFKDICLAQG